MQQSDIQGDRRAEARRQSLRALFVVFVAPVIGLLVIAGVLAAIGLAIVAANPPS